MNQGRATTIPHVIGGKSVPWPWPWSMQEEDENGLSYFPRNTKLRKKISFILNKWSSAPVFKLNVHSPYSGQSFCPRNAHFREMMTSDDADGHECLLCVQSLWRKCSALNQHWLREGQALRHTVKPRRKHLRVRWGVLQCRLRKEEGGRRKLNLHGLSVLLSAPAPLSI